MAETLNKKAIIILGDWVIDEYWLLVRHYSNMSSHTGYTHYRISTNEKDTIADLCGAGNIARILYELNKTNTQKYDIIGIGNWKETDTEYIEHLIHSQDEDVICPAAKSNFQWKHEKCNDSPGIKLYTLKDVDYTIKVIRQYTKIDDGYQQLNRIDWEPYQSKEDLRKLKIKTNYFTELEKYESVVICVQDFNKGAIDKKVIKKFSEKFPEADWFVRSKNKHPKWLSYIKKNIRVYIHGPEIANDLSPWENWMPNGKISKIGLETLAKAPGENAFIITENRKVLGKLNNSEKGFTAESLIEGPQSTFLGWPSAFMASLVNLMIDNDNIFISSENSESTIMNTEKDNNEIKSTISSVIKIADRLCGIRNLLRKKKPLTSPNVNIFEWEKEIKNWEQSREGMGIINSDNSDKSIIEVWRGYSELNRYVTIVQEKAESIDRIGKMLRSFSRGELSSRSQSVLLQADPGSGKTHFSKIIAEEFNFDFLRFDITQMINRVDLLDMFDTIASMQASSNNNLLVFVDEINAKIEGEHVFSAFLTPLEEGFFIRKGNAYSLRPCVWIFAGTKIKEDQKPSVEKFSDFSSRVTLTECFDYNSIYIEKNRPKNIVLDNSSQLEQVYLGAIMIKNNFPDVTKVAKEVLDQFYKLKPKENPSRKIRKMAQDLTNVQYGVVTREQCQKWDWDAGPKNNDNENLISLIF